MKMRDSGVPWLGEIPEHWTTVRIKLLASEPMAYGASEASESSNPSHPRFIRITDIDDDGSLREDTFRSLEPDVAAPYLLLPGDLLLARSGATVGKALLFTDSHGVACFAGYLIRFRTDRRRVMPEFVYAITQSAYYWWCIREGTIQATIQNFSAEKYGDIAVALPPLPEQRAIVSYLAHETARIDALITAKKRILDLLAEKRKAVIATAVTRGLNPNVKLRDSGVPWLGEIPWGWECWKVQHLARVGNGSTPERDNPLYWTGGIFPWLNSSVVNQDEVTSSEQFVTEMALRECHLPRLKSGTVLVAITGQGKTRGQAVVLSIEATINQHMAFVAPDPMMVNAWFLRWSFYRAYEYLRSISDDAGGTKGALTCEDVSNMKIPLPPLLEQQAIVSHIARETAKLDAMKAATERTIALLKERRTALIAAAVTGQLDLGEEA